MKELKSKKTGRIQVLTEEEYSTMVRSNFDMKRFIVTDLRPRSVIPAIEVKHKTKK